MAFTPFVDDLALIEVFLMLAASILAYSGIRVWWAARSNKAGDLRKVLKGTAIPLGLVGGVTLILALWGEMQWPFLTSDGMGGYNIFFFDPLVLFSFVLLGFAICAAASIKLQYVGVLALVAGAVTMFYGWTGYTANPAFTKDPFDTLLLYAGFGLAGVVALPASVVVDYYLDRVEAGLNPWSFSTTATLTSPANWGTRAAQPVFPGAAPASEAPAPSPLAVRMPYILQGLVLLFPVIVALAGIAALWYFGVTLPGHLGGGAGAAP